MVVVVMAANRLTAVQVTPLDVTLDVTPGDLQHKDTFSFSLPVVFAEK